MAYSRISSTFTKQAPTYVCSDVIQFRYVTALCRIAYYVSSAVPCLSCLCTALLVCRCGFRAVILWRPCMCDAIVRATHIAGNDRTRRRQAEINMMWVVSTFIGTSNCDCRRPAAAGRPCTDPGEGTDCRLMRAWTWKRFRLRSMYRPIASPTRGTYRPTDADVLKFIRVYAERIGLGLYETVKEMLAAFKFRRNCACFSRCLSFHVPHSHCNF